MPLSGKPEARKVKQTIITIITIIVKLLSIRVTKKIPLGFEELYDWPTQLWRAAGYVHGTACEKTPLSI